MKRRSILAGLSAAGAALAWPTMISKAFAQEDDQTPADAFSSFEQAWRDAQANHRPLLVFVIPSDVMFAWDRGAAFGAVLNHGSDDALQAIGTTELACARMREVRRLFPHAPASDPLMLRIDPGVDRARIEVLDGPWPPVVDRQHQDWEAAAAASDRRVTEQLALITSLLQRSFGGQLASMTALARAEAQARTIATYRQHAVPGSHWAHSSGCATEIEGEPITGGIGCGMGHVPQLAQRFLFFFAVAGNPTI